MTKEELEILVKHAYEKGRTHGIEQACDSLSEAAQKFKKRLLELIQIKSSNLKDNE